MNTLQVRQNFTWSFAVLYRERERERERERKRETAHGRLSTPRRVLSVNFNTQGEQLDLVTYFARALTASHDLHQI